jgi:AraC-like DNA-binding protein
MRRQSSSLAGACITLTGFSRRNCLTPPERTLKNILILYLLIILMAWITVFCYIFFPKAFVFLNIPCLAGFVLPPVFFYRIIRYLTRMGQAEQFSPLHYLVPALIGAVFLVWSLFVPFDVQVGIVASRGEPVAGKYELYSRLFTSKPLLRVVFMLVYYGFIARLLVRYYREASDADSPVRKPAQWIMFLIVLSLAFVVSTITSTFLPRSRIVTSIYTLIVALCISGQFILLTFHIIRRKYLLYTIHTEPESEESEENKGGRRLHAGKLTRRRLNTYFREQKPYLQGDFKITALVEAMDVNRSVLSAFINKSYGVNFNRFVNRWRLKELERLRTLPSNKGKSVAELSAKAGFTTLLQYYRALAAEREEKEV